MDFVFLRSFTPRILEVVEREQQFWERFHYVLERDTTLLHTLAYVYRGNGMLQWGGQRTPPSPGCVFQIRPGEYMRLTTSPADPVCFYSVHFFYGLVAWEGAEMIARGCGEALPFPRVRNHPENPLLHDEFSKAYERWMEKANGYEWFVKNSFFQILQQLSVLESREESVSNESAAVVQNTIDYMKKHYNEGISRDDLAKIFCMSPGYFSVFFKKNTGISPIQYLNKIRLDRAKQLLKTTGLPVRKVAWEVGFSDSFYFTRLFTKETGMPPRDFRNA